VNILVFFCIRLVLILIILNIAYKSENLWANWKVCCVLVVELAVCICWFLLSGRKLFCFLYGEASLSIAIEIKQRIKKTAKKWAGKVRQESSEKSVPSVSSTFSSCHFKDIYLLRSCGNHVAISEEQQYPIDIRPSQWCSPAKVVWIQHLR